jgi:hypothetical protein
MKNREQLSKNREQFSGIRGQKDGDRGGIESRSEIRGTLADAPSIRCF